MDSIILICFAISAIALLFRVIFKSPSRYTRNTTEPRYADKDMARGYIGPIEPK